MIGKIIGKLDSIQSDSILVNVNNICYIVYVNSSFKNLLKEGSELSLFIHSVTKEDGTYLYGFESLIEKMWFTELIKISGISGKTAILILSELTIEDIIYSINTKEPKLFKSITGIGPKLATRIVNELKDISKNTVGIDKKENQSTDKPENAVQNNTSIISDATSALINLGFNVKSVFKVVKKTYDESPETNLEELIRLSIKELSKK